LAKRIIENRFGVGSTVVDGLMRATNLMLHGKTVVVIGCGYCIQPHSLEKKNVSDPNFLEDNQRTPEILCNKRGMDYNCNFG